MAVDLARDPEAGAPATVQAELRERVIAEVYRFLESVPEADLGTVYRTLVNSMGAHVVPHIASAISDGLRRGEIEMEPRVLAPDVPPVAFVRRGTKREVVV